jgi:TRAP-type C4-dicarboxylate transport system substrate-binding protein
MNEKNQIPNELFNLVESKTWSALSENEKTIIIKWLNSKEKKFRQKKLKEIDNILQEKEKIFVTIKFFMV